MHLQSVFLMYLQIFQDFQGMGEEQRHQLLTRATSEGLVKVAREGRQAKKMARIKDCFLQLTKTESWNSAKEWYPDYADESLLKEKFIGTNKHIRKERAFLEQCTK